MILVPADQNFDPWIPFNAVILNRDVRLARGTEIFSGWIGDDDVSGRSLMVVLRYRLLYTAILTIIMMILIPISQIWHCSPVTVLARTRMMRLAG